MYYFYKIFQGILVSVWVMKTTVLKNWGYLVFPKGLILKTILIFLFFRAECCRQLFLSCSCLWWSLGTSWLQRGLDSCAAGFSFRLFLRIVVPGLWKQCLWVPSAWWSSWISVFISWCGTMAAMVLRASPGVLAKMPVAAVHHVSTPDSIGPDISCC